MEFAPLHSGGTVSALHRTSLLSFAAPVPLYELAYILAHVPIPVNSFLQILFNFLGEYRLTNRFSALFLLTKYNGNV